MIESKVSRGIISTYAEKLEKNLELDVHLVQLMGVANVKNQTINLKMVVVMKMMINWLSKRVMLKDALFVHQRMFVLNVIP